MKNENEERLIEFIVTIGSLIFFALLSMYAMRGCSGSESIHGDISTAPTTVATVTSAVALDEDKSVDTPSTLMDDTIVIADVNATTDADVNATTDADANVTTDADANATTDADASATTDADTSATTDANVNATTGADVNATTDADANATTDADANATTDADANATSTSAEDTAKSEADEEAGIIADINSARASAEPYVLKGVYFKSASSVLTTKSKRQLDVIAEALKVHKSVKVSLRGHTDSQGSKKENQTLSMKRARSVGLALVERGVNIDNIWIDGMGETQPITLNGTAKEMLLNRRVDIAVTK